MCAWLHPKKKTCRLNKPSCPCDEWTTTLHYCHSCGTWFSENQMRVIYSLSDDSIYCENCARKKGRKV